MNVTKLVLAEVKQNIETVIQLVERDLYPPWAFAGDLEKIERKLYALRALLEADGRR